MQTHLADWIKDTPDGLEANAILRKCVHCGFCLATCPTYQLLGDELDSPRGRIYLIKQMLEGAEVTERTQLHLDRCLTCRACETTCPSGVQYGRLVDIGRAVVNAAIPSPALFGAALTLGRLAKPVLPAELAAKVPTAKPSTKWPQPRHSRRMVVLRGCVQPQLAPNFDAALARVLDRYGISLVTGSGGGCCGAVAHHLDGDETHAAMKRNIDSWWPLVESGVEGIVATSSGCGATIAEYGHILRSDPNYRDKAARVSELFMDTLDAVACVGDALQADLARLPAKRANSERPQRIAYHPPCSLQHGLKKRGQVERWLTAAGFELTHVPDSHLCCGSAGTYSILQPELSQQLLANKIKGLESAAPDIVATANIGCLTHLEQALRKSSGAPIRHWIEIIDERLLDV
jgi:glycolate oxidase iron-sulfur subunit